MSEKSKLFQLSVNVGYWRQRADKTLHNLPQSNHETLVVKNKVGRLLGKLGVSKSMECDTFFPSVI